MMLLFLMDLQSNPLYFCKTKNPLGNVIADNRNKSCLADLLANFIVALNML